MTMHYIRFILDCLTFFSLIVIFCIWGLNGDFSKKEKKIGSIAVFIIIVALQVVRRRYF